MSLERSAATFESLEGRRLFSSPTDLDPSFSGDGKVVADFNGGDDVAHAVAVQSDGKIVVAGEAQVTVNGVKKIAFAAVRFNPDGSLDDGSSKDTTKGDKFGTGGKFTRVLDLGGGNGAIGIAIQKDGKIILAGNANKATNMPEWYFLRLNKDGSTDSTFGTKGVETTSFPASVVPKLDAILLQPDGKLVAAGQVESDWFLIRLTTAGKIDNTFGGNHDGQRSLDFGGGDEVKALAGDQLGRIIVAGNTGQSSMNPSIAVARLTSDGLDDATFGTNGRVSGFTLPGIKLGAAGVEPSGDILLGVSFNDPDHTSDGDILSLDTTGRFLAGGGDKGRTSVNGITVNEADQPLFGGTSINGPAPESFFVANLFDGKVTTVGFGSKTDHNVASAMTIGADGKVIQVGTTTTGGGGRNFAIARYLGTPTKNLGVISGNVFLDTDGDGVKDPNEPGLSDRRVFIDSNNNGKFDQVIERSVLTDANGNYKLFIAPGTYHVRQILPNMATATLPVATPGVYTVKVAAKQTVSGIDFGDAPTNPPSTETRLIGSVFSDFNGNGMRDVQHPTEPDLSGRTVFLDLNRDGVLDNNEPSTMTDAGGNYVFNLDAVLPMVARAATPFGVALPLRVRDILPAGWINTNPSSGFFDVPLTLGQTSVRNFGTTFADPDDTISEANNSPGNQIKVGGSVNFSIANVTDVDVLRFTAKQGQRISFDVDRASGSTLNSFLRLFDSSGKQLASNDDGAAPGETKSSDSFLSFTFNTAGTYYIAASNNANTAYSVTTGAGDNGAGDNGCVQIVLDLMCGNVLGRGGPA